MKRKSGTGWTFSGDKGEFKLNRPDLTSYLYFPLVNEAGMMSTITPSLHGQLTTSHNTFLLEPVSVESLHNSRASRNFWVHLEGKGVWSAAGNSAPQNAKRLEADADEVVLEAGFLWQKVTRRSRALGIQSEVVSFVPVTSDRIELTQVTLTNIGESPVQLTSTAAIPLYARSADDLRDHRHVTSLLHRTYMLTHGVEVQPSLSFDERGHRVNKVSYSVLGAEGSGTAPIGFFPLAEAFIGEGGSYDWPEAVVKNEAPHAAAGDQVDGYETVGALRFATVKLAPGESKTYIMGLAITDDRIESDRYIRQYLSAEAFSKLLADNQTYWENKLNTVQFQSGDESFDQWMKWVTLQPILRRLYGNSFLPYHDYGRGGRGWRDLWQDCLALLVMEPSDVRHLLYNNYAGVRIDGTNATIIGSKPGEFVADRNNIPRVWMDHGAWPFMTTLLYLHMSGDLDFLFQDQTYFKDSLISWGKDRDREWQPEAGNAVADSKGEVYQGTILEHILLQNLIPFFNVGEHNNSRLEGADWNDGLDLASKRGESVAFTAFYASNLRDLAALLPELAKRKGISTVDIAEEMAALLDTLSSGIDYDSIEAKRGVMEAYFQSVRSRVSGKKKSINIDRLSSDLNRKADWVIAHLRKNEWIQSKEGYEWFNGYYNNDGQRVEGDHPNGVRMTLTGQVFSVMGGVASDEQVGKITAAVNRYLKDPNIGYRLNSNFGEIQQNLGRAYGFAFGHKENGAMFSHMTVMYANALFKRGFVTEGQAVLDSIYALSTDYDRSRMLPGIPEYISERGRGMYPYLTGSASWLLLTQLTEVYGVKGLFGDLLLEPKLILGQFGETGEASVVTLFADRLLHIVYANKNKLDHGQYSIKSVTLNGAELPLARAGNGIIVERSILQKLSEEGTHTLEVTLS